RSAGIGLNHIDFVILDGKLNVDQPNHLQRLRDLYGVVFHLGDDEIAQVVWRQNRVRVAGVYARGLDVLHDADNIHILSIAYGIAFRFYSAVEKVIKEYFIFWQVLPDINDVFLEFLFVDHDLHALATQHIGGTYQQRESDLFGHLQCVVWIGGNAEVRVWYGKVLQKGGKSPPVLRKVKRVE